MNIHVDTLFALGGRIYRPGPADAPDDAAKWAIERGYARPGSPALDAAPENKAHAAAPKRARKKNDEGTGDRGQGAVPAPRTLTPAP